MRLKWNSLQNAKLTSRLTTQRTKNKDRETEVKPYKEQSTTPLPPGKSRHTGNKRGGKMEGCAFLEDLSPKT